MRLVLRCGICSIHISLPRVPTQDGDRHDVEGVDNEEAKAHVFSIIARVAWHLELTLNLRLELSKSRRIIH